jgi:hypothetical protein
MKGTGQGWRRRFMISISPSRVFGFFAVPARMQISIASPNSDPQSSLGSVPDQLSAQHVPVSVLLPMQVAMFDSSLVSPSMATAHPAIASGNQPTDEKKHDEILCMSGEADVPALGDGPMRYGIKIRPYPDWRNNEHGK